MIEGHQVLEHLRNTFGKAPLLLPALSGLVGIVIAQQHANTTPALGRHLLWMTAAGVALAAFRAPGIWKHLLIGFATFCAAISLHSQRVINNGNAPETPYWVELEGTILSSKTVGLTHHGTLAVDRDKFPEAPGKLLVTSQDTPLEKGMSVRVTGKLKTPGPARNPGQFDQRKYLRAMGIRAEIEAAQCHILAPPPPPGWRDKLAHILPELILQQPGDRREAAIVKAILLGDKNGLSDGEITAFRRAGVAHLFAVSGLHIGLLGSIVVFFARLVRVPLRTAIALSVPVMFLYSTGVGNPPSAERATLMAAIAALALLLDREPTFANLISLAALIILTDDSFLLFQPSFLFSFAALTGLVLIGSWLYKKCERFVMADPFIPRALLTTGRRRAEKCRRILLASAAATIGAGLFTAPLTINYFNIITPVSILSNLILWPVTWLILVTGFATLSFNVIGFTAIAKFSTMISLSLGGIAGNIAQFNADLPGGHFHPEFPPPGDFQIVIYDIEDGHHPTLIRSADNITTMLGTGNSWTFESIIAKHMASTGIREIETLVLAHESINESGAAYSSAALPPNHHLYHPESNTQAALAASANKHLIQAGNTISIHQQPPGNLQVLHPQTGFWSSRQDDRQTIVKCHTGQHSILFLESASFLAQATIRDTWSRENLRSDVLVLSWPEFDSPITSELLMRIQPHWVILRRPPPQVPGKTVRDTIDIIENSGAILLKTQDHGAIIIDTYIDKITLSGHLSGEQFTSDNTP